MIITLFLSVCSIANGQTEADLLDAIDSNDTTLIGSEKLTSGIMDYIASCQDTTKSDREQVYDVILAVDNVLAHCPGFEMYKFVYQYLIYGFSELGVNQLVDYMMRLPYVETLGLNEDEFDELNKIAESYCRVKIGSKAPDIQTVTIDGNEFDLEKINSEYTILMFWSANCPHCRELIKEIGTYLIDKQDVAFVNVCVLGNEKTVRKLIRKSKINGFTIFDGEEWNSKIVNDYAVDMMPSVFLLDKDKIIIAKPFSIEDVKEIIK
ncbi:MAG: peroxiredoxin family protein [Bacteroidales bacterium]|nr:peroxiredoxin family protein [Bacteroidales bacterium]